MNFDLFKVAVSKQFEKMSKHQLFRSAVTKDDLWKTYLASFPAGTDPILKERTEHDCNCCKQFIRAVGDVVAVIDGKLVSIWDVTVAEPGYQAVTDALSALVHTHKIEDEFKHFEKVAGTEKTFTQLVNGVHTWKHFHVNLLSKYVSSGKDIPSQLNMSRNKKTVFHRALNELTVDSAETVLELISQNSLYRGDEFKFMVAEFLKEKKAYDKVPDADKDNYVWVRSVEIVGSVSAIHGSSIGTLLEDISNGVELEDAVKKFEAKVGGANYKRPTALVSKKMIESAKKTIEEMGFTSALHRRYATIGDINVNDILFADCKSKTAITGDVFDELSGSVVENTKKLDKVEEVTIDKFLSDILPKAESLEIMLDNNHARNLVSLIAPVDATANNMFKWNNKFSWSYTGDMADSIKERVKAAGGNVTGEFCCRLAWNNTDDLDFHMKEPNNYEIYFGNRGERSPSGGKLDVDANGCSGMMDNPVENIFYNTVSGMKEGEYRLFVKQYSQRESKNYGFEVEIELNGVTYNFVHENKMSSGSNVPVASFNYSRQNGLVLKTEMSSYKKSKVFWNIPTQTFQKVNVVMLSPNYWGEQGIGNKHYFFMIDGCVNDGEARGFYNEFLNQELDKHRKVLEMVGSKLKTEVSANQLSGVGFSSTQRNSVLFRVKGKFTRVVKVQF